MTGSTAFRNEADADLLAYMSMQRDDPDGARSAWGEFFLRFRDSLFNHCYKRYRKALSGEHAVEDLVQIVLQTAFEKARTFSPQNNDPEVVNRQISAWLNRIAYHAMLDLRRQSGLIPHQPVADPNEIPSPEDHENPHLHQKSPAMQYVIKQFNQLGARDQEIIQNTMQWYDWEKRTSRMPRGTAKALANELGTTATNLRQVRKRFFDNIALHLQSTNTREM